METTPVQATDLSTCFSCGGATETVLDGNDPPPFVVWVTKCTQCNKELSVEPA